MKRNRIPPEELHQAKELLAEGAGYEETARTTGISLTALYKHFPGQGMPPIESGRIGYALMKLGRAA